MLLSEKRDQGWRSPPSLGAERRGHDRTEIDNNHRHPRPDAFCRLRCSEIEQLVPQVHDIQARQEPSHSCRKLLRLPSSCDQDARVRPARLKPFPVKAFKVNAVVSKKNAVSFGTEGQLIGIGPAELTHLTRGHRVKSARPQDRGNYDGDIFVKIDRERDVRPPSA